jgi:hypothetical protein
MKNVTLYFAILILASSCGLMHPNRKTLRLVKVGEKEEILIERKKEKVEDQTALFINTPQTPTEVVTIEASSDEKPLLNTANKRLVSESAEIETEKIDPEVEEPTEAEKIRVAYRAEKDAKRSMVLLILSSAFFLLPPLVLAATILMGIGIFFYVRATRARFITPFGEKRQRTATIFLIISIVGFLVWAGLIALLVIFW